MAMNQQNVETGNRICSVCNSSFLYSYRKVGDEGEDIGGVCEKGHLNMFEGSILNDLNAHHAKPGPIGWRDDMKIDVPTSTNQLHNQAAMGILDARIKIRETLNQRGDSYGDYGDQSLMSQRLKADMHMSGNWHRLSNCQKESLEMLAVKLSRILTGEWDHYDSWHDAIGYLQLVVDRLQKPKGT